MTLTVIGTVQKASTEELSKFKNKLIKGARAKACAPFLYARHK